MESLSEKKKKKKSVTIEPAILAKAMIREQFEEETPGMNELERLRHELELTRLALRKTEEKQMKLQEEIELERKLHTQLICQDQENEKKLQSLEHKFLHLQQACGYLELKQGSQPWIKVWCKLIHRYLWYYRSRREGILLGHIDLFHSTIFENPTNMNKKHCIQIVTKEDNEFFFLAAKSEHFKWAWLTSFETIGGRERSLTHPELPPPPSTEELKEITNEQKKDQRRSGRWSLRLFGSISRHVKSMNDMDELNSEEKPKEKKEKKSFKKPSRSNSKLLKSGALFVPQQPVIENEKPNIIQWGSLTDAIWVNIFSFLYEEDLQSVLCVSKRFFLLGKKFSKLSDESLVFWMYSHQKKHIGRFLLFHEDFQPKDPNFPLLCTAEFQDWEAVLFLLKNKKVDPSVDDNYLIQIASECGQIEVVKELLKDSRVDPAAENNYAIQAAAEGGHSKVVKLLLQDPRVDPAVNDNYPLQVACDKGHVSVVKKLAKDNRVDKSSVTNIKNGNMGIFIALGLV